MGLDRRAKLVTHVGGGYKDKKKSLERFLENWKRLPERITGRFTLENDDKTFTAGEVLFLCARLGLPMVLDIHHYRCNPGDDDLAGIFPEIISTWARTSLPPKIHISSPKSPVDFRSHHDFVSADDLYPFLKLAREFNHDLDVMWRPSKRTGQCSSW
jgi:UV DNA damage endonuclease